MFKPSVFEEIREIITDIVQRLKYINLPPHPFPKQFSTELDQSEVNWADRIVMVASTPRCGSTLLGHMLMQTGSCGVPLEYMHPDSLKYWSRRFGTTRLEKIFPQLVRLRTTPNGTFSFKAHWSQFTPHKEKICSLTNSLGIEKVIWISRRNQLSQAISWVIAEQTGVWISGAPKTGEANYDYSRIVEKALKSREHNLAWRDYLNKNYPSSYIDIVYEDMIEDKAVMERLTDFLEIQQTLSTERTTKRQSDNLNSQWKNQFVSDIKKEDQWILDVPSWIS